MRAKGYAYLLGGTFCCLVLTSCGNGSHLAADQGATRTVYVTPTAASTVTQTVTLPPTSTDSPKPTSRSEPPSNGPPGPTGDSTSPFDLRTFRQVGKEYRVSVTGVNLDADQIVRATNEFNDLPDGRYVLAEITVEYLGNSEGDPWLDLGVTFVGTDARQYDANACGAVIPLEATDVPTLEHSGRAHYEECFDVPANAIAGGKIFVEESFSFNETRLYWTTR